MTRKEEMAAEWELHQVGDLIEEAVLVVGDGYRAKNEELSSAGLPFARAGNINEGFRFADADHFPEANLARVGNKVSQPGDVVFTSKGTVGRFGYVRAATPKFVYSPQLCFWRSLNENRIHPRFLYYWMFGREFFVQFKGVAGQTDMAEYVSLGDQRRMHITLPPPPEQRAIAHVLGTLDDKIGLNRRMNETLEGMARALFRSWFVDFDPVRSKAEGRDPALPKHVADIFPDRFEDSEMGEIPAGWKLGTLSLYARLNPESWTRDGAPKAIEYVDLANTKWGRIESTADYLWDEAPSRAQRILRPGDTIVGTVRPGNGSYTLVAREGLTGSTGFAVLRPSRASYTGLVYLAATAPDNIERLAHLADGAAYPAVRPAVVVASPVVRAVDAVVERFGEIVSPLLDRMAINDEESDTLAALRDNFLPKLISGQLRIERPERILALEAK